MIDKHSLLTVFVEFFTPVLQSNLSLYFMRHKSQVICTILQKIIA